MDDKQRFIIIFTFGIITLIQALFFLNLQEKKLAVIYVVFAIIMIILSMYLYITSETPKSLKLTTKNLSILFYICMSIVCIGIIILVIFFVIYEQTNDEPPVDLNYNISAVAQSLVLYRNNANIERKIHFGLLCSNFIDNINESDGNDELSTLNVSITNLEDNKLFDIEFLRVWCDDNNTKIWKDQTYTIVEERDDEKDVIGLKKIYERVTETYKISSIESFYIFAIAADFGETATILNGDTSLLLCEYITKKNETRPYKEIDYTHTEIDNILDQDNQFKNLLLEYIVKTTINKEKVSINEDTIDRAGQCLQRLFANNRSRIGRDIINEMYSYMIIPSRVKKIILPKSITGNIGADKPKSSDFVPQDDDDDDDDDDL